MANTKKHSQKTPASKNTNTHNTNTTTTNNNSTAAIPTICIDINERNNNNNCNNNNSLSVTHPIGKHGVLNCLPDIFTEINLKSQNELNGHFIKDDLYKPFIIDNENGKFPGLSASSHGSLGSITTTSIASFDDPKGGDDGDGKDYDRKTSKGGTPIKQEEWWKTTLQVSIPFLVAGIGTIGAGIVLGRVEKFALTNQTNTETGIYFEFEKTHWKVFAHISELFILVPALLGLKGNLDMCLASRLSTQANLGNMTSKREVVHMIIGNIALVQVQATVAAFIVAVFAISIGAAMNGTFIWAHAMLLVSSSMFTATTSCFVLDFVLVAVILLSHRFHMNPDNLATPLAASIGDVVSLSVLSFIASLLFENLATHFWVTFVIVGLYFVMLPFWITIVLYNKYTRSVLKSGWVPVLSALFISGMGGLVLDAAVGVFNGFVVFQPIINGIGGNLVSVQASKISTMLHQSSIIGIVPPHATICVTPWRALISGVPYAKTARILILMSIPGQILFIYLADYIHMSTSTIGFSFVLSYMFVSLLQICTLLYIAHIMIHAMWKYKIDPDNSAIPYLTALGDLFGSSLLAVAFLFLSAIGSPYGESIQDTIPPTNGLYPSIN